MGNECENSCDTDKNNGKEELCAVWFLPEKEREKVSSRESQSDHTSRRDQSEEQYDKDDIMFWLSDGLNQWNVEENIARYIVRIPQRRDGTSEFP